MRPKSLSGFCSPPPTFLCVWFYLKSVFKGVFWAFAINNCLHSPILPVERDVEKRWAGGVEGEVA